MDKLILILFLLFISSTIGFSQTYDISWKKDTPILGVSAGMICTGILLSESASPITEANLNDLNINDIWRFDRSAALNFSSNAGNISDIFREGIYLVPFSLFFSGKARSEYKSILLMYSEVYLLNGGITILTKEIVGRNRPYAYNEEAPLDLRLSATTRRSFFSGHVSHVSSLSFLTASIYSDIYPKSAYRYAVWAGAITAPAITGYLRYRAGRHFPSDIIVGYGVGALIGYMIPKFHKSKSESGISLNVLNNGCSITYILK